MLRKVLAIAFFLLTILVVSAGITYVTTPSRNAGGERFDAIIVLGSPAGNDGLPTVIERARVRGAVEEYKAGRAPHVIFTGGAAHNRFVESEVMARVAISEGIPISALEFDDQSQTTVQNIYFSNIIMQSHGWKTAEVVSDAAHLPRTALILADDHLAWRTHASPWPDKYPFWKILIRYIYETVDVARFRWFGVPREDVAPVLKPSRP